MADILIRGIPEHIHFLLKVRAKNNGRSMNAEVLSLLETVYADWNQMPAEPPEPLKGNFPLTDEWLQWAKEDGRA